RRYLVERRRYGNHSFSHRAAARTRVNRCQGAALLHPRCTCRNGLGSGAGTHDAARNPRCGRGLLRCTTGNGREQRDERPARDGIQRSDRTNRLIEPPTQPSSLICPRRSPVRLTAPEPLLFDTYTSTRPSTRGFTPVNANSRLSGEKIGSHMLGGGLPRVIGVKLPSKMREP